MVKSPNFNLGAIINAMRCTSVMSCALFSSLVALRILFPRGKPRTREVKGKTRLLAVTRIHKASPTSQMVPIEKVVDFVNALPSNVDKVMICVGIDDDSADGYLKELVKATAFDNRVVHQHVKPWGRFVHALNVAVSYAKENSFQALLFMSLETRLSTDATSKLLQHLGPDVLVAGAALPGHTFQPGHAPLPLTGRTTPWNTAAVWDVTKLGNTGFPLVGDGDAVLAGGVEEVSAIALRQHVDPTSSKAILLAVPGMSWETNFEDPERRVWHEKKMASKNERPRLHMAALGIPAGEVWHYM